MNQKNTKADPSSLFDEFHLAAEDTLKIQFMIGTKPFGKPFIIDVSGAKSPSYDLTKLLQNRVPHHYQLLHSKNVVELSPKTLQNGCQIQIKAIMVNDPINFQGASNASILGAKNAGAFHTAGQVRAPKHYHFDHHSNGKFQFQGTLHTFNVVPNQIKIQYFADGKKVQVPVTVSTIGAASQVITLTKYDLDIPQHYLLKSNSIRLQIRDNSFNQVYPVSLTPEIMHDPIHFSGDTAGDLSGIDNHGPYNMTGHVSAPQHYHFVAGDTGKFTFNGTTHTLHVLPNEIKVHIQAEDFPNINLMSDLKVDTHQAQSQTYDVTNDIQRFIPKRDHLAKMRKNQIRFVDEGYDHLYNVLIVENYIFNPVVVNGCTAANIENAHDDLTMKGVFSAPQHYHLINGNPGYDHDETTHIFEVVPDRIKIQFTLHGKALGYSFQLDCSEVKKASFDVTKRLQGHLPFHYELANAKNLLTFGNQAFDRTFSIPLKPAVCTDSIIFKGNSNLNQKHQQGRYRSEGKIEVPPHYHVIKGELKYIHSGKAHAIKVIPDEILIQFQSGKHPQGSRLRIDTRHVQTQTYNVTNQIKNNVPQNYCLTHPKNLITFKDNGYDAIYLIDIKPALVADPVDFVGNSAHNLMGQHHLKPYGQMMQRKAPQGYHYINGDSGHYKINGILHVFQVIPNEVRIQFELRGKDIGKQLRLNTKAVQHKDYFPTRFLETSVPKHYRLVHAQNVVNFVDNGYDHLYFVPIKEGQVNDPLIVQGASSVNTLHNQGVYQTTGHFQVPSGYHFIHDSTGKYVYGDHDHIFQVAPNEIKVQFQVNHRDFGAVHDIDTDHIDAHQVDLTSQLNQLVPDNYPLANSKNVIDFGDNGYNRLYRIPLKAAAVTDQIDFVGDHKDHCQKQGTYQTMGQVPAPDDYHFLDGQTGTFKYTHDHHEFRVAPNEIRVQFQLNGHNFGTVYDLNTTKAKTNYLDLTDKLKKLLPAHYQLIGSQHEITFVEQGYDHLYQIPLEAETVTDEIDFSGDHRDHYQKQGTYQTMGQVPAPDNYHFLNNQTGKFKYSNVHHEFGVAPDEIRVQFQLNGHNFGPVHVINTTGVKTDHFNLSEKVQTLLPAHYHLAGSQHEITFVEHGYDHLYRVPLESQMVIDHFHFRGNHAIHLEKQGAYHTAGHVSAPAHYHFVKGSTGDFKFAGETHEFMIAPNEIKVQFKLNGQDFGAIKTINTKAVDAQEFSLAKMLQRYVPKDYSCKDPHQILAFQDGGYDYLYRIKLVSLRAPKPKPASKNALKYSKERNESTNQVNQQAQQATLQSTTSPQIAKDQIIFQGAMQGPLSLWGYLGHTGAVNPPAGYHFNGGQTEMTFVFNNQQHVFPVSANQVSPQVVTERIVFHGDLNGSTSLMGYAGQKGAVNPPTGYHFVDRNAGHFVFDGQTRVIRVAPDVPQSSMLGTLPKSQWPASKPSTQVKAGPQSASTLSISNSLKTIYQKLKRPFTQKSIQNTENKTANSNKEQQRLEELKLLKLSAHLMGYRLVDQNHRRK